MAFTPAIALGFLVVFLVGAWVTFLILDQVQKRKKPETITFFGVTGRKYTSEDRMREDRNYKITIGGGILAVVLMLVLLFSIPQQTAYLVMGILTVVGILFGISTFFWNRSPSISGNPAQPPPLEPDNRPPLRTIPTSSAPPSRSTSGDSRSGSDNPYLDLLIRVRYDTALADRLIEYERKRLPKATMDELCRSAIERLERDNR